MEPLIISPNKIMGMLVYRTREALNKNEAFRTALYRYAYHENCLVDDNFLFWHYPGTSNEISNALLAIGENVNGARLKFPSVLNFQSIKQQRNGNDITIYYNLAIAGSVQNDWTTEQREVQVFDCLLRPIYKEFMNQIVTCGYFKLGYGLPVHTYYEVFTTGGNASELKQIYGDYIDAIELHNLTLTPRINLCDNDLAEIEKENLLVTQNITTILNN